MATPGPAAMNQFMYTRMPYDTASAFTPIVLVATNANVFVVGPKTEAKSIAEFVAQMKAKPDAFNFGSAGNGSTGHLGGTLFAASAGAKAQHVPYRGSAPMLQDLMAGNIQFTIDSLPGVMSFIRSGTLRALAITDAKRSSELPDVPTMPEAGLPDVIITSFLVLLAPAGTPRDIIDRLQKEIAARLLLPETRDSMSRQGAEPVASTPDQFTAFIKSEMAKWSAVIKSAGLEASQ
jgi:tripartite-type tricarboxylate transporter receptor subunit TctC